MSTPSVDPQKMAAAEEQSFLHRESPTFRPEDYYPHRLSPVDSTDDLLSLSRGSSRASCNTEGVVKVLNSFVSKREPILHDEEGEEEEAGRDTGSSAKLVEHLFKELKGINKIQEEISDLRQYLTSVHGSVDEASCCVDAFLCEIEELYSEVSTVPLPVPSPQRGNGRRGSLGRQKAVTSPCAGCLPSGTIPKYQHVSQVAKPLREQTNPKPNLWTKRHSRYTTSENHFGFDQSISSLSSCLSPAKSSVSEADEWPLFDGGWSEEDVDSVELCFGGQTSSEVLLSDNGKPDGDCSSWRNVALLGSAHSSGRNWMDSSFSATVDALDNPLTETDATNAELLTDAGFNTTAFRKAMLTFRFGLGALKKLEATDPLDNAAQDFSSTAMVPMPVQDSLKGLNEKLADLNVCSLTTDQCPSSISQESLPESMELPAHSCLTAVKKEGCTSECEPWSVQPSTDGVQMSPIKEDQAPDHSSPKRPCDVGHRERIAKFQQILREKKQLRQRLSRNAQDSQGSQSSQCSQCSQTSQCRDEFISGIE